MGLESRLPENNVVTTWVEGVINWARSNSVYPLTMGLACCAIEMMVAGSPRFDIARFGSEVFRPTPRQPDLMIVSGRISTKMAPVVRRLYEQMTEPKWVIAMGDCACSGGMFNNYAILQGADHIVPVDVYVPGCPPRPEALLYGLMQLQKQIRTEKLTDRR
jgi:NADH-quinone oxidoreductase subunit B